MNKLSSKIIEAKPKHELLDNKRREMDKIHRDKIKNYKQDIYDENADNDDMGDKTLGGPVCDVCQQHTSPKQMNEHDYYFNKEKQAYEFRNVCDECLRKEWEEQDDEDQKRGKEAAEEVQKKYNLSNSYNADSIEEPNLRNYVQALLSYYNSWGDPQGNGYTKYCERELDRAGEVYDEYLKSQENKKANRIINRMIIGTNKQILKDTVEDINMLSDNLKKRAQILKENGFRTSGDEYEFDETYKQLCEISDELCAIIDRQQLTPKTFSKKNLNKQSSDDQKEYLLSQLMPWWQDQHHWNPNTLKTKSLYELIALKSRMLNEGLKTKQTIKEEFVSEKPLKPEYEQVKLFSK